MYRSMLNLPHKLAPENKTGFCKVENATNIEFLLRDDASLAVLLFSCRGVAILLLPAEGPELSAECSSRLLRG